MHFLMERVHFPLFSGWGSGMRIGACPGHVGSVVWKEKNRECWPTCHELPFLLGKERLEGRVEGGYSGS